MVQAIGNGTTDVIRIKGSSPGKDSEDLQNMKNRYEAEIEMLTSRLEE